MHTARWTWLAPVVAFLGGLAVAGALTAAIWGPWSPAIRAMSGQPSMMARAGAMLGGTALPGAMMAGSNCPMDGTDGDAAAGTTNRDAQPRLPHGAMMGGGAHHAGRTPTPAGP